MIADRAGGSEVLSTELIGLQYAVISNPNDTGELLNMSVPCFADSDSRAKGGEQQGCGHLQDSSWGRHGGVDGFEALSQL